jgi:hypothetical protein
MDDLRLLRHVVYETAGRYHLTHGEFFTSLVANNKLAVIKAAIKARKAGALYKVALQKLISYLTVDGLSSSYRDEILRAKQTIDTIDKEMQTLVAYQQTEASSPAMTAARTETLPVTQNPA